MPHKWRDIKAERFGADNAASITITPELIEHVARALVDADLPQFGKWAFWPAADDTSEKAETQREEARELATVAINAVLEWQER